MIDRDRTITVGHLNLHNRGRALRYMLRQRCDSYGFDEAHRRMDILEKHRGYRLTAGPAVRGATPLLTRDQYPHLGALHIKASEAVEKSIRVAPDRWVTVEMFAHPHLGMIARVNVHPNAVTINRPVSVPRVRETAELWASVDRLLRYLRAEGFKVILSGDLNSTPRDKTPNYRGAYDVIGKHRLEWIAKHVDCIAFDPALAAVHRRVVPKTATGSDHDGLILELGWRP